MVSRARWEKPLLSDLVFSKNFICCLGLKKMVNRAAFDFFELRSFQTHFKTFGNSKVLPGVHSNQTLERQLASGSKPFTDEILFQASLEFELNAKKCLHIVHRNSATGSGLVLFSDVFS